jgi:DNA (cytosine-5)-methyltransferase 1
MQKIRVVELFAGVGGFRIGLERASNRDIRYEVVWSSQWEPGAVTQHASEIYIKQFGDKGHSCEDIKKVVDEKLHEIEDHDLLVGGFPCQDYSVARTLNQAAGLKGKKGVLWWSIHKILEGKGKKAPTYLMLENVDRLLKSPASQRGRDFAVMLASLADLGYVVEWRVVNAAEYGFPQRRRRVFIFGYKKNSNLNKQVRTSKDIKKWITKEGVTAKAFPVMENDIDVKTFNINGDLAQVSDQFSKESPSQSPFRNAGVMIDRNVYTLDVTPKYTGARTLLGDVVIHDESVIPEEYFIDPKDEYKWTYLKGGKTEKRLSQTGHEYNYSEGAMTFPDPLDRPSRTIVTGEGGTGPSRFKHVIQTKSGRLRRLTPLELERLNMFPEDHTAFMKNGKETSPTKRAFIMGNALVVGVITEFGKSLRTFAKDE